MLNLLCNSASKVLCIHIDYDITNSHNFFQYEVITANFIAIFLLAFTSSDFYSILPLSVDLSLVTRGI